MSAGNPSARTLFDRPLCHEKDPVTSFMAADKIIETGTVEVQLAIMVSLLERFDCGGGNTWRELAQKAFRVYKFDRSESDLAYTFHRRSSIAAHRNMIYEEMKRICKVSGYAATAWRARIDAGKSNNN